MTWIMINHGTRSSRYLRVFFASSPSGLTLVPGYRYFFADELGYIHHIRDSPTNQALRLPRKERPAGGAKTDDGFHIQILKCHDILLHHLCRILFKSQPQKGRTATDLALRQNNIIARRV